MHVVSDRQKDCIIDHAVPATQRKRSSAPLLTSFVMTLFLAGCVSTPWGQKVALEPTTINGTEIKTKVPKNSELPRKRIDPIIQRAASKENERIVAAYGGIYSNAAVEKVLARVVSRLVAASEVPSQPFRITILNSPAVNAFALPGGYLYITRGLLALANDDSELAAVLAHEMAHITSRHGIERLRKARDTKLVSTVVKNVFTDRQTAETVLEQRKLDFVSFTQAQELEADTIGVRNAGVAGFDPFAAARFLQAMATYQSVKSQALFASRSTGPDFLSSHPTTPQRISRAQQAARQFGAPGIGKNDRNGYLKAIDGMIFGDDPKEGFVRDRSFYHPSLRLAFSVPRGYVIENTREAVLATASNEDAIRFDGVKLAPGTSLTNYLKSGWLNGLRPESIREFSVNGLPAASAEARVENWTFRISLFQSGQSTYRFIFATERPSVSFDRAVSATTASFRVLTADEAARLGPLRLKIVKVRSGDTLTNIVRPMSGLVRNPQAVFKALNNLPDRPQLKAGTLVKIITDR